ncbi:MAG: hypothetical protein Q8Q60_02565 [Candidatus Chromulinivorax sp.]|nr:hypothetical protein [Candidatus Chromulinivorax sp.]
MIHTTRYNILFFGMLFSLTCSINNIQASVNDYTTAQLFAKYDHSTEEQWATEQCENTEQRLKLITKDEANILATLEQDKKTLKTIKSDATYWLWPNHPDDNAKREQAEKSLKHLQQTEDFLQHHAAYLQAQKIGQFYSSMPTSDEGFKIWVAQRFPASQELAIINCRHNVQTAISTIDHFSAENKAQYPQLYNQLVAIRKNINTIFPKLETLYQTASERQKAENTAHEHRELVQKQIEAQNRASKAMESHNQAEKEKISLIQQFVFAMNIVQQNTSLQHMISTLRSMKNKVNALQQRLDLTKSEEQRLLHELSALQKMLDASIEYENLNDKQTMLENAIEKNKRTIQYLHAQQAALQQRIECARIPSQTELNKQRKNITDKEQQLREQNETIDSLNPEVPSAEPCNDSSYPYADAHYAPEPNDNERPPAENPNYRESNPPAYNPNYQSKK